MTAESYSHIVDATLSELANIQAALVAMGRAYDVQAAESIEPHARAHAFETARHFYRLADKFRFKAAKAA